MTPGVGSLHALREQVAWLGNRFPLAFRQHMTAVINGYERRGDVLQHVASNLSDVADTLENGGHFDQETARVIRNLIVGIDEVIRETM